MSDWDKLKTRLKCCACGKSMTESVHINCIRLNKYAEWEYPAWGNILAIDEDKKKFNRATSIICDECVVKKAKPDKAIEIKFENDTITEIIYHDIKDLKDAEPITEDDLIEQL